MAKINCLRFKNQFLNKCIGFPNFPFHIELSTNFFSEKLYVRNQQHIEYDIFMHTRIVTCEEHMAFLEFWSRSHGMSIGPKFIIF